MRRHFGLVLRNAEHVDSDLSLEQINYRSSRRYVAESDKFYKNLAIKSATMLATLIIGLMAGPAVSLYGSPTVSPVTAAL